jgi:hypothetical protein
MSAMMCRCLLLPIALALGSSLWAGCGLLNAFGGNTNNNGDVLACDDETGVCRCATPTEDEDDAECSTGGNPDGGACFCDNGELFCDASRDIACEVRQGGDCFNAFCDCEAENRDVEGVECHCSDAPGLCTSFDADNKIEADDFACFGGCACGIGDNGDELCACLPDLACLLDAEGFACTEDADCDVIARAEAHGCDPFLPSPNNGCRDGERCLNHPVANVGVCFLVESESCPPGYALENTNVTGPLCVRIEDRPSPQCLQGTCDVTPPR